MKEEFVYVTYWRYSPGLLSFFPRVLLQHNLYIRLIGVSSHLKPFFWGIMPLHSYPLVFTSPKHHKTY